MNLPPTHTNPASQLGYSTSPSCPAPPTSLLPQPFQHAWVLSGIAEAHKAAFQSRMGNELPLMAWRDCLVCMCLECWVSVASEHSEGKEVFWLKISVLIWRNSDELVGSMIGWGDGHQIKFTPVKEKVLSGACLSFQTFWGLVSHPSSWCSHTSCMGRKRIGCWAKPRKDEIPSSCC